MKKISCFSLVVLAFSSCAVAQQSQGDPKATEVWSPEPKKVQPGASFSDAPSDATVLFDGTNLNEWISVNDSTKPAEWKVADGILTVDKSKGNIQTKKKFGSYQLHLEFRVPATIEGEGQARGNSGLFLASTGPGDDGYELQILDNYENKTYVNGQVGAIYKQSIPLANPDLPAGQWNKYDIVWNAPEFNAGGKVTKPATVTVFLNGVLVQNNYELKGPTKYIGKPAYEKAHGKEPIKLQSHGDPSEPISFRNIWIREL